MRASSSPREMGMRKNHQLFIVFSALLASALACAQGNHQSVGTAPSTTAALAASRSMPVGTTRHTLIHGGLNRSYLLYVPAAVDWSKPVPLVFVLHGGTGNAESAVRMSGFHAVADRHGFLVAYPNGTNRLGDDILLTWNGGACCGYASDHDVDDVGFLRAV